MIQDDAFDGPPKRQFETLDTMSIDEIEAKIARLRAEIDACERAIAAKKDQRAAADAVFGRPPA